MAAGALIKAGTPAACSPVSSAQAAHTAALPRTIQYVEAETPSKRSVRNTRTACGTASRHESAAPHHASNSTTDGHLHQSIMKLRRLPSVQIPSGFLASAGTLLGEAAVCVEWLAGGGEKFSRLKQPSTCGVRIAFRMIQMCACFRDRCLPGGALP
jgi:hypothetical protein